MQGTSYGLILMDAQSQGRVKFTPYIFENKIVILNESGICVASADSSLIGQKIDMIEDNKIDSPELRDGLLDLVIQNSLLADHNTPHSIDLFISRIVSQPVDKSEIPMLELEAKTLGLNLENSRVAIVINYPGFEEKFLSETTGEFGSDEIIQNYKKTIISAICGFFTRSKDLITAYIGNSKFIVLKAMDSVEENNFRKYITSAYTQIFKTLSGADKTEITVGFSNPYKGVSGIIESYREANLAQEINGRLDKKEASYFFGDVNLLYLFANELCQKITQDRQHLNNLDRSMLKTLETFLHENLNISKTARKLRIHRNSVNYRLDKIASVIKLDPRKFEDATTILILLLSSKLLKS
jgi:carbohydrate diacid regulator